jgi:hypothetical protein
MSGEVSSPRNWEKNVMEWEALAGVVIFIGEGEREGVVLVPHVGDHTPALSQTSSDTWKIS